MPTEKFSMKNRGLTRYSPPRYQPVNLHRNSQPINEVFKDRQNPRFSHYAVFTGFGKPHLRSDYFGANKPAGTAVTNTSVDLGFSSKFFPWADGDQL